jgi:thiol-disulfide isomerase/thioredoxin
VSPSALLLLLAIGCAARGPMAERDPALEVRVTALEHREQMPSAPTAADEEAATALIGQVQEARAAGDYATARAKVEELLRAYPDTRAGKVAPRMADELNLVGTDAAPLVVASWYTREAFLDPTRTTVLVFWEEWCPHCEHEMPRLPELRARHAARGVDVIALTRVTKSSTDEAVRAFIAANGLQDIPVGKELDGSMSLAYAVTGIPAAAVVKGGKVIWRGHPAQLDDATMERLTAP